MVRRILELTGADESLIEYVTDRPGHDRRYSLSSEKLAALGWAARTRFEDGLARTVDWYRENAWWWEPIRSGAYREYYERHYGRALKALSVMATATARGRHAPPPEVRLPLQRERLLRAAALEFAERGYAGASSESISRRAGMSKATFYEHFANKEECMHRAVRPRRRGGRRRRWPRPRAARRGDARERMQGRRRARS